MLLSELLKECRTDLSDCVITGNTDIEISGLAYDSRSNVGSGTLFACFSGRSFDGHVYAEDVVNRGASCLLVSKEVSLPSDACVTIIKCSDVRYVFAFLSAAFYGNPGEKLRVIGITGTKGKTTSAFMTQAILNKAGISCGLVGTVHIDTGKRIIEAEHTTPEALELQQYFREMVENGLQAVVMEVSSLALKMHRTQGFTFEIGLLTNLSPDHIGGNEHDSFGEYAQCKKLLFKQCRQAIANKDDAHFESMTEGITCPLYTFSIDGRADLMASRLTRFFEDGMLGIEFTASGSYEGDIRLSLPGNFSVYNALTAMSIAHFMGVRKETIGEVLSKITIPGRIEMIPVSDSFTLMIDYAHNAVSLESLLTTLRKHEPGRLVTLFGCGGNRDRKRRFEMGEVSGRLSDFTIITSDNPRFEEPSAILDDIENGIRPTGGAYVRMEDRRDAIRFAIENGQPGDIIVLAGKGQETYQEIKGIKYPMDERIIIREILAEK